MALDADWKVKTDDIMGRMNMEENTSSLAQYVLEDVWDGDDPDSHEIEMAFNEIKNYIITYWACNPDT